MAAKKVKKHFEEFKPPLPLPRGHMWPRRGLPDPLPRPNGVSLGPYYCHQKRKGKGKRKGGDQESNIRLSFHGSAGRSQWQWVRRGERGEIGDDFRVLRGGESCAERGHRWLGFFGGKSVVWERDLGERGGSG